MFRDDLFNNPLPPAFWDIDKFYKNVNIPAEK